MKKNAPHNLLLFIATLKFKEEFTGHSWIFIDYILWQTVNIPSHVHDKTKWGLFNLTGPILGGLFSEAMNDGFHHTESPLGTLADIFNEQEKVREHHNAAINQVIENH